MAPNCSSSTLQPVLRTLNSISIPSARGTSQSAQPLRPQSRPLDSSTTAIRWRGAGRCTIFACHDAGRFDGVALPAFSSTRRAHDCWRTSRALPPGRAASRNSISPSAMPSVACGQSFSLLGRQRLCAACISQSAGQPNCWERVISGSMSASRSATYTRRVDASRGARSGPSLIAFDPAQAFFRTAALATLVLQLARPHPSGSRLVVTA